MVDIEDPVLDEKQFVELLNALGRSEQGIHKFLKWRKAYNTLFASMKNALKSKTKEMLLRESDKWGLYHNPMPPIGELSTEELTNALLFFPSRYLGQVRSDPFALAHMDSAGADLVLLNESASIGLRDAVLDAEFEIGALSPEFSLELAFAAAASGWAEEVPLLKRLAAGLDLRDSQARDVAALLRRRIAVVSNWNPYLAQDRARVALVITGQVRGMDDALPELAKVFSQTHADVFVSTWSQPGRTKLDRARARRVFTPEAASIAERLSNHELEMLNRGISVQRTLDSGGMEAAFENAFGSFPTYGSLRINTEDGDRVVFNTMNNAEKMYYHNFYWTQALGRKYLAENYDYIIKVRPDIRLTSREPFNIDSIRATGGAIATEASNWKFASWGIGIGDQLIHGPAELVNKLLSVWPGFSESIEIRTRIRRRPQGLLGHSNLAIDAWLSGASVLQSPLRHRGYHGDPKIDVEEIKRLCSDLNVKIEEKAQE